MNEEIPWSQFCRVKSLFNKKPIDRIHSDNTWPLNVEATYNLKTTFSTKESM